MFKDKQIDVNNHSDSYMQTKKIMVKYIDGIRLKQGEIQECPTCDHYTTSDKDLMSEKSEKPMNIESKKPIKRNRALQGVSREHHHGLLLCWKIRTGFSKGISEQRIKKYTDWFYIHHLIPHFELEEKSIFPILGNDHEMVKKALSQHKRLHRLFAETEAINKSLSLIEEELEQHIRFEERILFNEIQKIVTEKQLETISITHNDEKFKDNVDDSFWI